MTPTLRKQLDELKAAAAPEPPVLIARMAHGEDAELVIAAACAKQPDVEFGLAVLTRVWGAQVRPELTIEGRGATTPPGEHPSAKTSADPGPLRPFSGHTNVRPNIER